MTRVLRLAALLAAALGCGRGAPATADPDRVVAEEPYRPIAAAISALIRHEMTAKGIPAVSIALVDGPRTVWAQGFGRADAPAESLATANTVYRIGSVSTLFTTIAIMQLVERGRLDLDEPIQRYLPDFHPANPFGGRITLRHLMSHRAGLTREPPVGNHFDPSDSSLAHMVESLNRTRLLYPPGQRVKYSNAGIGTAGYGLEKVQREPFAAYMAQAVLEPMGLASSAFAIDDRLRPRLARATMWTYDEREFPAPTFALGVAPAEGMYSTVNDLARFAQAIFDRGQGPGRALDRSTFTVAHDGAIYGFTTHFEALPEERLAVAVVGTKDAVTAVTSRIGAAALSLLRDLKRGRPLPGIDTTVAIPDSLTARVEGEWANLRTAYSLSPQGAELVAWRREGETRMILRRLAGDTLIVDDELAWGPRVYPLGDRLVFGSDTLFHTARPPLPPPPPAAWRGLIGEYGWDHNTLFVLERGGKLNVLIEWLRMYPLTPVNDSTWRFPEYGLYQGEELGFRRDSTGRATEVRAGSVSFRRRNVGPEDGSAFHIDLIRPVDELRREALAATPPEERGTFRSSDLVELVRLDPTIKLDIRYADTTNFARTRFYEQARAFLQRPAAEALVRANRKLHALGYGVLVHDGYRPWYVTKMFWDGTAPENHTFVADPSQGSRHNRGCAVDLTLYDLRTGRPVVMTGSYDEFSDRSYPYYPGGTSRQRWLRDLLRRTMTAEGFSVYEAEWWHFDYRDWRHYRIGNERFQELR